MSKSVSRLETIDPTLSRAIKSSSTDGALEIVANIILETVRVMGADVTRVLLGYGVITSEIPPYVSGCSQDISDALDIKYFDFEESGNSDQAHTHFAAARLVSACVFYTTFSSLDDLCEAAYEAISAKE